MRAAYDGIYFDLRRSIDEGVYQYKDYLPSESVLIKRYGCAHNTVRKALGILAREGYVQPIHGKGVRVLYRPAPCSPNTQRIYDLNSIEPLFKGGNQGKLHARTKVLVMDQVEVSPEFAAATGFDEGETLVHLERVRFIDDKALERESNYFRADIVEGMTKEDAERSIYHYIEDVRGGKLVTSKRQVTIEHADERDRELLSMEDATYVAVVRCATFDGEGLLCEISTVRHTPQTFLVEQTALRTRVSRAARGNEA